MSKSYDRTKTTIKCAYQIKFTQTETALSIVSHCKNVSLPKAVGQSHSPCGPCQQTAFSSGIILHYFSSNIFIKFLVLGLNNSAIPQSRWKCGQLALLFRNTANRLPLADTFHQPTNQPTVQRGSRSPPDEERLILAEGSTGASLASNNCREI